MASGRQVPRAAHLLRQQDGPHGRRFLSLRADDDRPPGRQAPGDPDPRGRGAGLQGRRRSRDDEGAHLEGRESRRGLCRQRHSRRPDRQGAGAAHQARRYRGRRRREAPRSLSRRQDADGRTAQSAVSAKAPSAFASSPCSAARRSRTRAFSRCWMAWSTTCRRRWTSLRSKRRSPSPTKSSALRPDDKAPFAGLAFKIMDDPFVGSITFVRIYSGTVISGTGATIPSRTSASASAECC